MEFGDIRHLDFSPRSGLPERINGATSFYIESNAAADFRAQLSAHAQLTAKERQDVTQPSLSLSGSMEGYVFLVEEYNLRPDFVRTTGKIACMVDEQLSPPLVGEYGKPLHYLMYVRDQVPESRIHKLSGTILRKVGVKQQDSVLVRMQPDCNHLE